MQLRAHRAAERELRAAIAHDEAERPGRGLDLAQQVEKIFRRLELLPRSAPPWPRRIGNHEVRRAKVKKHPYFVVYTVHDDHLLVVAIAHTSNHPGYWSRRLEIER